MVKASDIIKEQQQLEKNKEKTFKKILEKINTKIKATAITSNKFCWMEIPEFIIGLPLYDVNECIKYLRKKLKKNGFTTSLIKNNILLVTW